jgi:hypothetical protein
MEEAMRIVASIPVLVLAGLALAGCNTGAPQGVLPRDPLPPPPSLGGDTARPSAAAGQPDTAVRRRAISVPARVETPRPQSPTVEPVMTPGGAGAGIRF